VSNIIQSSENFDVLSLSSGSRMYQLSVPFHMKLGGGAIKSWGESFSQIYPAMQNGKCENRAIAIARGVGKMALLTRILKIHPLFINRKEVLLTGT